MIRIVVRAPVSRWPHCLPWSATLAGFGLGAGLAAFDIGVIGASWVVPVVVGVVYVVSGVVCAMLDRRTQHRARERAIAEARAHAERVAEFLPMLHRALDGPGVRAAAWLYGPDLGKRTKG